MFAAVAALLALSASPVAAGPGSDARIRAEIDAYIVAHPTDYRGIDTLQFKYRGSHIAVVITGVACELTADQAADWMANYEANQANAIVPMSGIQAPALTITKQAISGGVQFWGWWNFPDTQAWQGSPYDLASTTIPTNSCTRTQNHAIWTYRNNGSVQTHLGSMRSHAPNQYLIWNVADYVTNFQNQADKGLTRLEVVRTASCSGSVNVGAAFDYEGNKGGGISGISIGFGFLSVSYSVGGVHDHWGTDAIWTTLYPS